MTNSSSKYQAWLMLFWFHEIFFYESKELVFIWMIDIRKSWKLAQVHRFQFPIDRCNFYQFSWEKISKNPKSRSSLFFNGSVFLGKFSGNQKCHSSYARIRNFRQFKALELPESEVNILWNIYEVTVTLVQEVIYGFSGWLIAQIGQKHNFKTRHLHTWIRERVK